MTSRLHQADHRERQRRQAVPVRTLKIRGNLLLAARMPAFFRIPGAAD
jgi:hypothetical protein